MNRKETAEIRRRLNPEKSNIPRVYGCYVNQTGEIISHFQLSTALMQQSDRDMYFGVFKKVLSGTPGKNRLLLEYGAKQAMDSEQNRLLRTLNETGLGDAEAREKLFQSIIQSVACEENYLILLAADAYDVPFRSKEGDYDADRSEEVFRYFLCAVCPVKDPTFTLSYCPDESDFRSASTGSTVAPPFLGFMFPAFSGRRANIYQVSYYAKDPKDLHGALVENLFGLNAPMSAPAQQEAFSGSISESLESDCSFSVVQAVHEEIRDRLEMHKEARIPEEPEITIREVGEMLSDSGVKEETVNAFKADCARRFGGTAVLNPNNIVDSKRFEITTPDAVIRVSPESSSRIELRMLEGRRYILIPADDGVEVNGIPVSLPTGEEEE